MTFLNLAMLAGLAAVAVPILVHLLHRRRASRRKWGAMRFLLEALAARRRRIRLEEMILLALRCFLVALVVLAMARPFLPSRSVISWALVLPALLGAAVLVALATSLWATPRLRYALLVPALVLASLAGTLAAVEQSLQQRMWRRGAAQKDIALVLDASSSMWVETDGKTAFQRAVDEAKAVIAGASPADAFTVLLAGEVPEAKTPAPTHDREEILRVLDELEPVGGAMDVAAALGAAGDDLAAGSGTGRSILLITDGQRVGWSPADAQRWETLADRLVRLEQSPPEVVCRLLPGRKRYANLAVTDLRFDRRTIGTDRPVRVAVTIANHGEAPLTPDHLELMIDGQAGQRGLCQQIAPGSSQTVEFTHRFATPGRHAVSAVLASADDLDADDEATRMVDVIDSLPVLIVDGASPSRRHESAAVYMADALAPPPEPGESPLDEPGRVSDGPATDDATDVDANAPGSRVLVAPRVVRLDELDEAGDLERYRAVILANVPLLPDAFAERVREYVAAGGGLIVAAGKWCEPAFYNRWGRRGGAALMPAKLPADRVLRPDRPVGLASNTFSHPALGQLAEGHRAEGVAIRAYWPLRIDAEDGAVSVGGLLTTGEPWLLERAVGRGKVLLLPSAMGPVETNLPSSQSCFVYLMHELVYYLAAGEVGQANLRVGETMVLPVAGTGSGSAGRGRGLRGEYFAGENFRERVLVRVDPTLEFQWDQSPGADVPADGFSVRWTGRLEAPRSGRYTFHVLADDGVRLWIDGKKLLDEWTWAGHGHKATANLRGGRKHDIRIDYREVRGNARFELRWARKDRPTETIPTQALYPTPSGGRPAPSEQAAEALARHAEQGQGLEVVAPDGRRALAEVVRAEKGYRVVFPHTARSGTYRLRIPPEVASRLPQSHEPDGSLAFVVVPDPSEGRIEPLTDSALDTLGDRLARRGVRFRRASRPEELTAAVSGKVPGEEWWRYLVLVAVAGWLAETALTRWIALSRRKGTLETVRPSAEPADLRSLRTRARRVLAGEEAVNT
jgi:hypothetical protein